jgi:hypothetical protein
MRIRVVLVLMGFGIALFWWTIELAWNVINLVILVVLIITAFNALVIFKLLTKMVFANV